MNRERGRITSLGTAGTFLRRGSCSEALITVLDRAFGHPMDLEEHASMHFAGGISQHGYQCGIVWGAALAAGAQAYRLLGSGPEAEARAVLAAQEFVARFHAREREINCLEITETNWKPSLGLLKYFLTGGPVGCVRMAVRSAPAAYDVIDAVLADDTATVPAPPVSCAAVVAERMGASELHTVMAAGFAGGVGLSGGGCGALGAAIWITGMRNYETGGRKDFSDPVIGAVIERFLNSADHEFECAEIVGRKFDGLADHAAHLRDGGCAAIIEALAA